MTELEFSKVMERISQYWSGFYAKQDADEIFSIWYPLFKNDDASEVQKAVIMLVCTLKFPPTVADIKTQLAENRLEAQPTSIEAFQTISEAVSRSYNRDDATEQYKQLPPILRKLVGSPAQLISWRKVSDEAFQTVVMSAIRESYTTLAKREAKYYALPAGLQKLETWRIDTPSLEGLPEPEKPKTVDEIVEESNAHASEHGMKMTQELQEKHSARVADFLKPVTKDDVKRVELREKQKSDWSLK